MTAGQSAGCPPPADAMKERQRASSAESATRETCIVPRVGGIGDGRVAPNPVVCDLALCYHRACVRRRHGREP